MSLFFRGLAIFFLMFCMVSGLYAQEAFDEKITDYEPGKRGLRVEPGVMILQNVGPGELIDIYDKTKIALVIHNRSERTRNFDISTGYPSDLSMNVVEGYRDIPDRSWFRLEKTSVTLPPYTKKRIKMYLDVPKGEQYLNQRWVVGLVIATRHASGEKIALGVQPTYYIETKAEESPPKRPDGAIGAAPSIVSVAEAMPGRTKNAGRFVIYNNDDAKHTYTIEAYVTPEKLKKQKIVPYPGYERVPDTRWIRIRRRRVSIEGRSQSEISFDLSIPKKDEYLGKQFEGILMIRSDDDNSVFVRVLLGT